MRVISLLPAATEIVAALGATDQLVGVTHECDYPPDVTERPQVTRSAIEAHAAPGQVDRATRSAAALGKPVFVLDEALVMELRPELIITQALCDVCAVSEDEVRMLADRLPCPPRVVALCAAALDDVWEDIVRVGDALGRAREAQSLVASLHARIERVHATLKAAAAPRPRVAALEWTDPVYAAAHWVPQMIHRGGGLDVLGRAGERSPVVEAATVRAAHPEVVLVAPCGYDVARAAAEARRLLEREPWRWLAELRVWAVDANALTSRPGPRLVDGIETIAAILHPGLFPAPSPGRAREAASGKRE